MSKMQTFLLRYASGRCQVHAHTKKNITPKAYANDKRQQELSLFFFFFLKFEWFPPANNWAAGHSKGLSRERVWPGIPPPIAFGL